MKIKTGDKVRIIAGKDKGKEGTVLQVFHAQERVVVEGANIAVRHLRPKGASAPGQKVTYPAPLHASNVQLLDSSGKPGRAGYKTVSADGSVKKVRVVRRKGTAEEVA